MKISLLKITTRIRPSKPLSRFNLKFMNNPTISIIVAMDEKHGVGKANKLLWQIPGELPRFKKITMGHPIIMGRITFESIGRVLPGRTNIIITRDSDYHIDGAIICSSIEKAIEIAKEKD